ncbi:SDR family NAD(P)-dependent oxidoreductase [Pontivivens ytuae]|uniref:Mycofactocin-coupled SDR family oxidoreductase n=1 Tax=Pontivivens ytuae TaxID=2789856 RepID=A0A7S9LSK2_9RHOB|nr:SDR family oxidoreductase [Pontivivens ytuae]QPH54524.1 mycofactocin-coupled SDR family oxidoreductase [Pontivivens ytuae]
MTDETDPTRRALLTTGTVAAAAAGLGATAARAQGAAPEGELAGRTALVTGAARAIGRATAVALAEAGADVALLDIADPDAIDGLAYPLASQADLDEAVAAVEATGRRALPIVADVRSYEANRDAVAQAEATFGRPLDIFVANAALVPAASLDQMTDAQWRDCIDVNLTGVANGMRAALPGMAERGSGRFLATSSTGGRHGMGGRAHYAASKWGLIGLIKSAAMEYGPSNVTVNAVSPTAVESVRMPQGEALERAAEYLTTHYNTMPIAFLPPEAIADSFVFLASDRAQYITGEIVEVAAGANARFTA